MIVANGLKIGNEEYILVSAVSATYDSAGNNIAETLEDKLEATDLRTINGEAIVGTGDLTVKAAENENLTKANLKYNRYLEDTVSTEAKPYIKEIRSATLDMEEFGKLGTGLFIHWGSLCSSCRNLYRS